MNPVTFNARVIAQRSEETNIFAKRGPGRGNVWSTLLGEFGEMTVMLADDSVRVGDWVEITVTSSGVTP